MKISTFLIFLKDSDVANFLNAALCSLLTDVFQITLFYHLILYFQGFVLGDMAALVAHAKREAFRRVLKMW